MDCRADRDGDIGSTPRMRGIYPCRKTYRVILGFNPAYAGNIFFCSHVRSFAQVQPRVCGEYVVRSQSITDRTGSTPRMRGILMHSHLMHIDQRFNPAYAGNIHLNPAYNFLCQVQPRVCGEYLNLMRLQIRVLGSTPRMRGI